MKPGTILQIPVSVWKDGRILDYGGPIEDHSDNFVTIAGIEYLKAAYEFRVR